MPNARERIEKVISENPVVLFMKGTPEFPQCGFSGQVIQILDYLGAPVVGVNVLEDADIRQGIKEYANWPTVPQLYIKGEFAHLGRRALSFPGSAGESDALRCTGVVPRDAGWITVTSLRTCTGPPFFPPPIRPFRPSSLGGPGEGRRVPPPVA
jgi:monothiol glutaredoxin